jgi:hypothetical protein
MDGDDPVAACCFQVEGETLAFLGGFDVTDYMGPVGSAGSAEAVAKELVAAVTGSLEWRRADLRGLPATSPWFDALAGAFAAQGLLVRSDPEGDGITPLLHLPRTFEEYLAGIPAKLRHEIRRKRRRLADVPGGYSVSLADDANLTERMDRFIALHKTSPGPKGKFMHAGMEIFFRGCGRPSTRPTCSTWRSWRSAGRPPRGSSGSPTATRSSSTTRRSTGSSPTCPPEWS